MKKINTLLLSSILAVSALSQPLFASEFLSSTGNIIVEDKNVSSKLLYSIPLNSNTNITNDNENVSVNVPGLKDDIMEFGLNTPSASGAINISGTKMSFSGSSTQGYDLNTDNCFTGVSRVTIEVTNSRSAALTVKLYKRNIGNGNLDTLIDSYSFDGNSTGGYGTSGLSSSSNYYLKFIGVSNFSGYVFDI